MEWGEDRTSTVDQRHSMMVIVGRAGIHPARGAGYRRVDPVQCLAMNTVLEGTIYRADYLKLQISFKPSYKRLS